MAEEPMAMARRQRICELLLEHGYVDVGELSKQLER